MTRLFSVRPRSKTKTALPVIGAVVGGVLGKQVGGGSGKKLATVAGAAAGGYAGNKVQENMQQKDVYSTTERRCNVVQDQHERITGYQVSYTIDGEAGTVVMDHKPGDTIPLKDGELLLSETEVALGEPGEATATQ